MFNKTVSIRNVMLSSSKLCSIKIIFLKISIGADFSPLSNNKNLKMALAKTYFNRSAKLI